MGQIGLGWLVLLGVARGDTEEDAAWLAEKILNLRAFDDEQGKMNRSVLDVRGGILVVSQFTLLGDCRTGRRPSFTDAAEPARGRTAVPAASPTASGRPAWTSPPACSAP